MHQVKIIKPLIILFYYFYFFILFILSTYNYKLINNYNNICFVINSEFSSVNTPYFS